MFHKGDVVLYSTNGICDIVDISTIQVPGVDKNRLYYTLHMRNGPGIIYFPVDGDTSRMRKLISKEEALELVSGISAIEPLQLTDQKDPKGTYQEAIQKNDCIELLKLIKCIYLRKKERLDKGAKILTVDEKYMKLAENILYQELGAALDIPKDQVLDYLIEKME